MKTDEELFLHWNTVNDFTGLTDKETEKLKTLLFERYEKGILKKRRFYERDRDNNNVIVKRDASQKSLGECLTGGQNK